MLLRIQLRKCVYKVVHFPRPWQVLRSEKGTYFENAVPKLKNFLSKNSERPFLQHSTNNLTLTETGKYCTLQCRAMEWEEKKRKDGWEMERYPYSKRMISELPFLFVGEWDRGGGGGRNPIDGQQKPEAALLYQTCPYVFSFFVLSAQRQWFH